VAQAEFGEPAHPRQLDGVPQGILATAVRLPHGLGQQADAVVAPHRAGGDAGDRGELSDTQVQEKR
jgi:hypothetical protein